MICDTIFLTRSARALDRLRSAACAHPRLSCSLWRICCQRDCSSTVECGTNCMSTLVRLESELVISVCQCSVTVHVLVVVVLVLLVGDGESRIQTTRPPLIGVAVLAARCFHNLRVLPFVRRSVPEHLGD